MTKFTYGCDPEVFLRNGNKPASAYGLLPGDKKNPHKTDMGAIQVDGMAAEFNTDPVPEDDFEAFNLAIVQQLREIRSRIPNGYSISIEPVQEFGKEFLDTQPDEAKELGCDPDYNAYTLKHNPRPDADSATFRSGAGHLHFGWGSDIPVQNEEHIEICAKFVKILDVTVGFFMTIIDDNAQRRELYGKAGAMRPKPYGVEYRTPSNVWIKKRKTRRMMHGLMQLATRIGKAGKNVENLTGLSEQRVQEIINTGDHESAYKCLDRVLVNWGAFSFKNMSPVLRGIYNEKYGVKNVLD